ncbi:MAG: hypothetical protein SGI90_10205 [Candidatus Eisenbacteria bacterium]|nr:hypothetical protein [Candidatus Eisenbacteria bacterium]
MTFMRPARRLHASRGPAIGLILMLAVLMTLSGSNARAGGNPNAKIILHVVPWNNRHTCTAGQLERPDQVVTKGDLFPARYAVYALVVDGTPGEGISGVQFGITFNDSTKKGVDIIDWQECSLFNWPMPGWPVENATGNLLTWNVVTDCDSSGFRVAGFFYLTAYSPDRLRVVPRPADNMAAVIDCLKNGSKNEDCLDVLPMENLGFVDFGGGEGYNPWDPKQNLLRMRKPGSISVRDRGTTSPPASQPSKSGGR